VEGIRILGPRVIVVENVAALRTRGLARVLSDLATLGYDAVWTSLCAAHVGAAHRRERVFILAYRPEARELLAAADADHGRQPWRPAGEQAEGGRAPAGAERRGDDILPATDRQPRDKAPADAAGQRRNQGLGEPARQQGRSDVAFGDHPVASAEVPTSIKAPVDWGLYETAIRRWKRVMHRPAPYPVESGIHGQPRLAATFTEWLMGLPAGHVTGLGLPRGAALRALGNGVVPQQAEAAIRWLVRAALE
jgi:DNA (cytosine-5)-methyltransferase 1